MIAAADHLSTRDKHPIYDCCEKWATPGIWRPPSFNARKFQKRIDRICGQTANNQPIIRLVWAWESRSFFHTAFDNLGKPTKGEHRAKYRFMTVTLANGDEVDISVPRWILEERIPAGQLAPHWEQARYVYDPLIGRRIDKRGELPAEGFWKYVHLIAEHDPKRACCERAWQNHRRRCWGYYREPQDSDLALLERAVKARNADPYKWHPEQPLPEEAIKDATRLAFVEEQAQDADDSRILTDFWHDWVGSHGWRAFEDSLAHKTLTHGKYKFAYPSRSFTETPSGLVIPE